MKHAARKFYIADLHLGHKLMARPDEQGERPRPWDTTEDMDEEIVARWNSVVRPTDKVYLMGDATINRSALATAKRLQGKITLIMGNHDIFRPEEYLEFCTSLKGAVQDGQWILTHIPVHASQMDRFAVNIHGHLHKGEVMRANFAREVWDNADDYGAGFGWGPRPPAEYPDPRYLCVSAEHTNYTPMLREELEARIAARQERYG